MTLSRVSPPRRLAYGINYNLKKQRPKESQYVNLDRQSRCHDGRFGWFGIGNCAALCACVRQLLFRWLETQNEIEAMAQSLIDQGLSVTAMTADVTLDDSVQAVVEQIVDQFGRIDVWVNNVGKSTRADVMQTGVAEYRTFMEINFLSAVRCWNACQDELVKSSGHLVNIGSLASKTGWPLMSPYSTSKHAALSFFAATTTGRPEQRECVACLSRSN